MSFSAYRLLIVVGLSALGMGGIAFANWWHRTDDLQRLDARAHALAWPHGDHTRLTDRHQDEPLLSVEAWQALAAPDADWSQPLAVTIDASTAAALDALDAAVGELAAETVHRAVEQTLLTIISGRINLDDGVLRCLRLLRRCVAESPGLDPFIQLVGPRVASLQAATRAQLAVDLRALADRESDALIGAMRATWGAVRGLPWVSSPSMTSANGWSVRIGREAYLDRFLSWGEHPPAITADLITQQRHASAAEVGLLGARAAWARAGTAVQLHLTVDAVARATLARLLAAACDSGAIPQDRCDPTAALVRQRTAGAMTRWYLVGLNGVDENGFGDDISLLLPTESLQP